MSDTITMDLMAWHKKQAVEAFNSTWDLIDKQDRTEEETRLMIHRAHASRYHWGYVGTNAQWSTGEWQIARVYALAGMGESALYHGRSALTYCEAGQLKAFDFAFACEAIARAYHVLGDEKNKALYLDKAKDYAKAIEDEADRNYALSELEF